MELACNLRREDRAEVLASSGEDLLGAVLESMDSSTETLAWHTPLGVGAVCGVAPIRLLSDVAVIWALTSGAVDVYPIRYVKESRRLVRRWSAQYVELINFVDARYGKALKWARNLGFSIGEPEPFGTSGLMFRKISKKGGN